MSVRGAVGAIEPTMTELADRRLSRDERDQRVPVA